MSMKRAQFLGTDKDVGGLLKANESEMSLQHGHLYLDMESGSNDSIDLERLMKSFQARLDDAGMGTSGEQLECCSYLVFITTLKICIKSFSHLLRSTNEQVWRRHRFRRGGRSLCGHVGRS